MFFRLKNKMVGASMGMQGPHAENMPRALRNVNPAHYADEIDFEALTVEKLTCLTKTLTKTR